MAVFTKINNKDIDLVIVGTLSSDYFFPGVSAQLQDKLNYLLTLSIIKYLVYKITYERYYLNLIIKKKFNIRC